MQNISFDKELLAANVAKRFLKFLEDFKIIDNTTNEEDKVYIRQAESMRTMDKATMQVDFHHILNYDSELAEAILSQHYRFEPFLRKTLQHFMFNLYPDLNNQKTFDISFFGLSSLERIRDLKTDKIGKLTAITGTVTRTTEVRPELLYGSFMCLSCHTENKDIEQQFKYTEPRRCRNPKCDNHTRWEISLEGSTFGDWQKIRIQEHANEIPTGGMPRSIDVVLRNEMVDVAKPGDRCTFVGSLVVVPEIMSLLKPGERVQLNTRGEGLRRQGIKPLDGVTGLKQLGVRDLNYKMVFLACHARPTENAFAISEDIADDKLIEHLTNDEKQEILRLKDEPQLYKRLAKSICPSVHGHEEIKKGILLMLFGGVNKTTMEGMTSEEISTSALSVILQSLKVNF
jgi:DNA replication licensing factor MCM6